MLSIASPCDPFGLASPTMESVQSVPFSDLPVHQGNMGEAIGCTASDDSFTLEEDVVQAFSVAEEPEVALLAEVERSGEDATLYSTGFEPTEGFSLGFLGSQQGWSVGGPSPIQPILYGSNPASGAQHLRIANDPWRPAGALIGGISPDVGVQPAERYVVSVDVNISDAGGADYYVDPKAQGSFATRVRFSGLGGVEVVDSVGGSPAWVDTGAVWNAGSYANLTVDINGIADTIDYYYGGELIYSSVAGVFAAETVEHVVVSRINSNTNDVGDFDNLSISTGEFLGEIHGFKWHDLNADGAWDVGEPALTGWEIYLDLNKNGRWDAGEPKTITGADGSYSFTGLFPGTYTVAEVMQDDWRQTYPGTDVSPASLQNATGNFAEEVSGGIPVLALYLDGDPADFEPVSAMVDPIIVASDAPPIDQSSGGVSVLHILVDFPDMTGPPITVSQAENSFYAAGEFMRDASWGEFWFEDVVVAFRKILANLWG